MLPPESAFCSNHDRKRKILVFYGLRSCILYYQLLIKKRRQNQRFEMLIQNADPKQPFTGILLFIFPSRTSFDDFVSMYCALFEAIVRAQVNRKGVYMTSFKRGYMWTFAFMLPPESAFCSNHDRKRTLFGRFESAFRNAVLFENKHGRNSVLL